MLELGLDFPKERPPRILLLGAHADDIEIGCGGTVLELLRRHADVEVDWVVFSGIGPRADEARRAAKRFLAAAGKACVRVLEFRDGFFPYVGADLKAAFEALKSECSPDLVFTHHRGDLHQDHRLVNELTWNTFRNHLILEYEIPKFDGDLGVPNAFAPLTPATCDAKIAALMDCYGTQRDKFWFSEETFRSILRIRGVEARSETGYAEAFHARKISILGGSSKADD